MALHSLGLRRSEAEKQSEAFENINLSLNFAGSGSYLPRPYAMPTGHKSLTPPAIQMAMLSDSDDTGHHCRVLPPFLPSLSGIRFPG